MDEIVFSEVMFDCKRNISGENPAHITFVKEVCVPLFISWGYKVTILRDEEDYLSLFYKVMERPRKHESHRGLSHGFPLAGMCRVNRDLKLRPMRRYFKNLGEHISYVGICAEETKRLVSLKKDPGKYSLLEELGITSDMAMELCREYGLLSPIYSFGGSVKRSGCWFCPHAKLEEHRYVKALMPDVWEEFVSLEKEVGLVYMKWNPLKETLQERDRLLERRA